MAFYFPVHSLWSTGALLFNFVGFSMAFWPKPLACQLLDAAGNNFPSYAISNWMPTEPNSNSHTFLTVTGSKKSALSSIYWITLTLHQYINSISADFEALLTYKVEQNQTGQNMIGCQILHARLKQTLLFTDFFTTKIHIMVTVVYSNKTNAQAILPRCYGLQQHLCRISAT